MVYLLHGANDYERGWTQTGMANTIMDNLIAEKKAVPAIIVMPFGHEKTGSTGKQPEILALQKALGYTPPPPVARGAAPRGGGPGAALHRAGAAGWCARGAGPGGRFGAPGGWSMEKEMLDYVIPYVEKEFRVIKDKDHRAIMGYSMGGGHAPPSASAIRNCLPTSERSAASVPPICSSPTRPRRTRTTR